MTHEIMICIFSAIAGGMVGFLIGGLICAIDIEKHCKGREQLEQSEFEPQTEELSEEFIEKQLESYEKVIKSEIFKGATDDETI